jgi:hypothetical protein
MISMPTFPLYVLAKLTKRHELKEKKNIAEHKTSWRLMYLFHDQFVPFFADEGRVRYMINNRFGHNCTFNIPEYNVYFLIVYYKDIVTVFQMKQYHSIIKKPFCFSHTFVCNNSAVLHPCNTDAVLHLIMIWTYINQRYYISRSYIS